MARRFFSLAVLASLVFASGCISEKQEPVAPAVTVMALDTSSSAQVIHEELFRRMLDSMERMKKGSRLILFRFDSSPAEFYDGKAIIDQAEAGRQLKPELTRQSETTGTNLAKLFERIETVIKAVEGPVEVHIYTDCGTEEMTSEDDAKLKSIIQEWHGRGVTVSFHGVQSGFRERLRDLVAGATID